MKNKGTQFLTEAAVIGAIYVVLTLLFAPLSYGEIQIRFSEALTILPFFTPAAPIPPIVSNAVIVPFVLHFGYGVNLPIPLMMLTVGIGEVVSCGVVGLILQTALLKYKNVIFRSQRTV